MKLKRTKNQLNPGRYWERRVKNANFSPADLALFDQNGYDLTKVEQEYAKANGYTPKEHRYRFTCKEPWYIDEQKSVSGPHINHADLYFRRGFGGDAWQQLNWAAELQPMYYKLLKMRPKWGIDISIDYVDGNGNCFELLHFEWDGFMFDKVLEKQREVEAIIAEVDWDSKAKEMIDRKDEWHHLDFFGQSDWKCEFWGLPKENFKEVIWK